MNTPTIREAFTQEDVEREITHARREALDEVAAHLRGLGLLAIAHTVQMDRMHERSAA